MGVQLHSFLTLELDGCLWFVSRSGRFIPCEIDTGNRSVGSWVSSKAGLDCLEKLKIICFYQESRHTINSDNHLKLPFKDEAQTALFKDTVRTAQ